MRGTNRVRLRALAKINLDLRVIAKRPDGYHELRTIFQTISLADTLEMAFTPAPSTSIEVSASVDIPDNLIARAARMALDAMRITGRFECTLAKTIPMGAGLGGGSSDAAAVLLALPVLAGGAIGWGDLLRISTELGSDVTFFLLGGTAVGLGRGTELYPLPDRPATVGLVVAPGVHVSTAEAYRALSPRLTSETQQNKMVSFQTLTWDGDAVPPRNDFEAVVFEQHPELARWKQRLAALGADPAMMTGSGSALFGLFDSRRDAARALRALGEEKAFPITLVSRARYRSTWWRQLRPHMKPTENVWPPRSRYSR